MLSPKLLVAAIMLKTSGQSAAPVTKLWASGTSKNTGIGFTLPRPMPRVQAGGEGDAARTEECRVVFPNTAFRSDILCYLKGKQPQRIHVPGPQ